MVFPCQRLVTGRRRLLTPGTHDADVTPVCGHVPLRLPDGRVQQRPQRRCQAIEGVRHSPSGTSCVRQTANPRARAMTDLREGLGARRRDECGLQTTRPSRSVYHFPEGLPSVSCRLSARAVVRDPAALVTAAPNRDWRRPPTPGSHLQSSFGGVRWRRGSRSRLRGWPGQRRRLRKRARRLPWAATRASSRGSASVKLIIIGSQARAIRAFLRLPSMAASTTSSWA